MTNEAQIINGVSAEGLAYSLQAFFAIMLGVAIGIYYNWKIALVSLACCPFMILGTIMNIKFQAGLSKESDHAYQEANLLAGDSIINYKTVASFANEDQILNVYKKLL